MSAWDAHLVPERELGGATTLADQLPAFLRWQTARWPRFAEARAQLAEVQTRPVRVADRDLTIQFNPARAVSTTAKVDAASISQRPCFLCPGNLPAEEGGLPFGAELVVLPNPAPILDDHLVAALREHLPQRIEPALGPLLDFARDANGKMTALYNGPRSGASAPDHLHLQAVAAGRLPEERYVVAARERGLVPGALVGRGPGFVAWEAVGAGRVILGVAGERGAVEAALREAIGLLTVEDDAPEPLLNVLARSVGAEVVALLFPRGRHRPEMFFAEGPGQRVISPGVIDMAGLVVAVRLSDYEQLDAEAIAQIYREVTLPEPRARAWTKALSERWSHG